MEALLAACCVGALNPTVLWSDNHFDNSFNVLASGDHAYVASGESGALIYDVSVPASPKLLGACRTRGKAYDVAIKVASGNVKGTTLLYVADDTMGMSVCDVTDPSSPKVIGTLNCPLLGCNAWNLEVVGNTVYLGDFTNKKVHIVNVADPTAPTWTGSHSSSGNVYDLDVSGSYLYVAAGSSGLEVVNVDNKVSPTRVARYPSIAGRNTPSTGSVIVKNNVAYLGTFDAHGMEMVDVSDPANPALMGKVPLDESPSDFALFGTKLFAACGSIGLAVMDVSDATSITLLAVQNTDSNANGVTYRGSVVMTSCLEEALVSWDASNPSAPTLIGKVGTLGAANHVHVVDGLATVCDSVSYKLRLYDVSNPSAVRLLSTIDGATASFIHGKYLFFGLFHVGVTIVDISDPTRPTFVTKIVKDATPLYIVKVERMILYVTDFSPGVSMYDVSNPAQPRSLGNYNVFTYVYGISVVKNYCYMTTPSGVIILDVTNPSTPTKVNDIYILGEARDVKVVGTVAYIAAGAGGLQIFELTNPEKPEIMGYYDLEDAREISVEGDTIYVADYTNGLYIFDVSDLDAPKLLKHMLIDGRARNVFTVGTTVYMADYGLRIIDAAPEVITPEPTPAPTLVPVPSTPEPTSEPLTDTEAPTTPAPQTPTEDDSSSDNALDDVPFWAWILIGVAVGACLGALIVFCACKKGDNPKSTPYP